MKAFIVKTTGTISVVKGKRSIGVGFAKDFRWTIPGTNEITYNIWFGLTTHMLEGYKFTQFVCGPFFIRLTKDKN